MMPSENKTECRIGYLSGFISEFAAMVSVAQNIAESINTYFTVIKLKIRLMQKRQVEIRMNPIKVATIPKYPMILKF